ncbi:MAG: alginate export family protein [Planctomycetota bacterium]
MSSLSHGVTLVLLGLLCACATPTGGIRRAPIARLEPGLWVEVEGPPGTGLPRVTEPSAIEIDEQERSSGDRPDRVEMTAPAESALEGGRLVVLGCEILVTEDTEFENLAKEKVAPFPVASGDWIKVKAEITAEGRLEARVVRAERSRGRYRLQGETEEVDIDAAQVRVGGVWVQLPPSADVTRLKGAKRPADEASLAGPLALFQRDERKGVPFTIRPRDDLRFGGQILLESRAEDEFDLNRDNDRDQTELLGQVKADMLWIVAENGSFVLVEGSTTTQVQLKDDRDNEKVRRDRLTRAYGYFLLSDTLRLQAGRQDFDESREWLYDEVLDGARLIYRSEALEFEVSASKGRGVLEEDPHEDVYNFIGIARYPLGDHHSLSAYVIDRRDKSDADFSPLLYGARSLSFPRLGLRHWAEVALADGVVGPERLRGYGIDAGVTYILDHDLRPAVTVSWALGTGDRDPNDDWGPFRQSGLQDNNDRFGGVTSFRYYGELLDPELSNLQVTTLGLGMRPARNFSVDVVGHTYRQDEAAALLVESNLRSDPNGQSRDLGWEMDMILGYRHSTILTTELVIGRFAPGRAFDQDDPAYLAQVQVRFKF